MILLTIMLLHVNAWPQDNPRLPQKEDASVAASIDGSVRNRLTGAPVPNAVILLSRDEPADANEENRMLGAQTDSNGHFLIARVPPGRYTLRTTHRRFVGGFFGARRAGSLGSALTISAGQHMSDVNITLLPTAAIAGRVVDENDEPLVRAEVTAMQYQRWRKGRSLVYQSGATTDDRGDYRVFGLPPGNYYLIITYTGERIPVEAVKPKTRELSYVRTFYPGVTDLSEASPVDVTAGSEVPVDFTMARVPTVRITGTIVDPGEEQPRCEIALLSPGVGRTGYGIQQDHSHFEIDGVAPGNYILEARSFEENGHQKSAREEIAVGNTPIEGVKVVLAEPARVQGRFRVDGNASIDLSQLYPLLRNNDGDDYSEGMPRFAGMEKVAPDGTFELGDVVAGEYRFDVVSRGRVLEDWYTKSVHFGSRDVTDSLLKVTGGGTVPLDVLISPAGATIQGVVKDANDHPVAAAMVVTVPQGKHQDRLDLYQTAATDQQGFFKIRGAAPGEYKVFAWEDVENDAWFDADFMKNYESQGTSVSVREWDRSTVSLRVIPSPKK